MRKYGDSSVWSFVTDLFDYLVLAVEIDNVILCVHGGLSPSLHTVDQIRAIDRFKGILTLMLKYRMRVPWLIWYGQTLLLQLTMTILRYPHEV
jgi:diadenosine tetraphosphatase ApaH/serine/threonine PP2A family protein phosphatase